MKCFLRLAPETDSTFTAIVKNPKTGDNVVGATGTVELVNQSTGLSLAGATWPLALVWNAETEAYEATIPFTVVVTRRSFLTAKVRIDGGTGFKFYDEPEVQVLLPSE